MQHQILKPRAQLFNSSLIILVHVVASFLNVPPVLQLVLNAVCCVYIGCFLSFRLSQSDKNSEFTRDVQPDAEQEKINTKDALQFPIYGSAVLLGLYILYKFIDKDILSLIFTTHFMFLGVFCLAQMIEIPLSQLPVLKDLEKSYLVNKKIKIIKEFHIQFTLLGLISFILAIPPTLVYAFSRHWLSNNIFGIAFSIMGINSLVLPNFTVGFILMWGLFFYDIFWVYGTDVMVTVAKNLDAPIKLVFVYDWSTEPPKSSMLGLGDIVIPGVFVALALKYDIDQLLHSKKFKGDLNNVSTPYFNWCFGGYIVGIVTTFIVMVAFNHAQPALLFLVPGCTLSVAFKALIDGKLKEIFTYEESKQEAEKKQN